MADKKIITNPSMGSNDVGIEKDTETEGVSAGTDTQLKLAAKSKRHHKKDQNINDDEKVIRNKKENSKFSDEGEIRE